MKEHPIIFSTDMVKAILDGSKTMTRRVVGTQPKVNETIGNISCNRIVEYWFLCDSDGDEIPDSEIKCPYGQVGDRLWVKETWGQAINISQGDTGTLYYKASNETNWQGKWKPSIFMPRWVSRIRLEITGIRVERLQKISHEDAIREGCYIKHTLAGNKVQLHPKVCDTATVHNFARLWDSINAKRGYSWKENPFVWVLEFRRIKK